MLWPIWQQGPWVHFLPGRLAVFRRLWEKGQGPTGRYQPEKGAKGRGLPRALHPKRTGPPRCCRRPLQAHFHSGLLACWHHYLQDDLRKVWNACGLARRANGTTYPSVAYWISPGRPRPISRQVEACWALYALLLGIATPWSWRSLWFHGGGSPGLWARIQY